MPLFNSSMVHPRVDSWHIDSCGRRNNNLVRDFPEGLKRLLLPSPTPPQIPMSLSGLWFLAETAASLTQRLGQESPLRVPVMSVEKLKVELHS